MYDYINIMWTQCKTGYYFFNYDAFIGKHWFNSFPKFPIISNVLRVKTVKIVLRCFS